MSRGLFLTLEGIDGSGKGTQLERIRHFFDHKGMDVLYLREPGGTAIGEEIRRVILDRENHMMVPTAELLLFAAARAQLVEEAIRPALKAGRWVLCDRFYDSTLAYQVGGRGLGCDMVMETIRLATGGLEPDVTLYLDLDPAAAEARRLGREAAAGEGADRIEAEDRAFNQAVFEMYRRLAAQYPRIRTIDASRNPDEVWAEIEALLESLL